MGHPPPADLQARVPGLAQLVDSIRARVASLTIVCPVPGIEIRLGDKVVGRTPLTVPLMVTSGRKVLTATSELYLPFRREIDLPGGAQQTVIVELAAKATSGVLAIQSNVAGARASMDARVVGTAPVEVFARAGSHLLRLEADGYVPADTSVVIDPGERRSVNIPLAKTTPLFAKWWFWTCLGVVAAGAVATAVALTSERRPDSGSLTPGHILGP